MSGTRPYDLECTRAPDELIVEVKGTTSVGEQIVLTRNEVAAHRARYPSNALIVVYGINLTRGQGGPKADGGKLIMLSPWEVKEEQLRPLAFQYTIGRTNAE